MMVLSVLLFWLPGVGALLAGVVGGKKAGGVMKAVMAVILPGIIGSVLLFVLSTALTALPLVGGMIAAAGGLMYLLHAGMMFVGAVIGGLLA